jgi:hypothetical protein
MTQVFIIQVARSRLVELQDNLGTLRHWNLHSPTGSRLIVGYVASRSSIVFVQPR